MSNSRQNVILITTDQQRFDTISALGNPYIDTRAYADFPLGGETTLPQPLGASGHQRRA